MKMNRGVLWLIVSAVAVVAWGAQAENTPGPGGRPLAKPFRIIAHRGASAYAPENTLPAFQKALDLGTDEVELDVQLTRDDEVVVFHDRTLDEKTSASGRVRNHALAQLRELEIGSWFDAQHPDAAHKFAGTRLVGLSEVFDAFDARLFYHVEIKSPEPELPRHLIDLVAAAGLQRRVLITSSRIEQLQRARALSASLPIALLIGGESELRAGRAAGVDGASSLLDLQRRWIDQAVESRFNQVAIPLEDLTPDAVTYAQGKGLEIRAYRIRSKQDMERAIEAGANGMTIDWPDWLIERVRQSEK